MSVRKLRSQKQQESTKLHGQLATIKDVASLQAFALGFEEFHKVDGLVSVMDVLMWVLAHRKLADKCWSAFKYRYFEKGFDGIIQSKQNPAINNKRGPFVPPQWLAFLITHLPNLGDYDVIPKHIATFYKGSETEKQQVAELAARGCKAFAAPVSAAPAAAASKSTDASKPYPANKAFRVQKHPHDLYFTSAPTAVCHYCGDAFESEGGFECRECKHWLCCTCFHPDQMDTQEIDGFNVHSFKGLSAAAAAEDSHEEDEQRTERKEKKEKLKASKRRGRKTAQTEDKPRASSKKAKVRKSRVQRNKSSKSKKVKDSDADDDAESSAHEDEGDEADDDDAEADADSDEGASPRRRKTKRPKRPLSGYQVFQKEHRQEYLDKHPDALNPEVLSAVAKMWTASSAQVKKSFMAKAEELKNKADGETSSEQMDTTPSDDDHDDDDSASSRPAPRGRRRRRRSRKPEPAPVAVEEPEPEVAEPAEAPEPEVAEAVVDTGEGKKTPPSAREMRSRKRKATAVETDTPTTQAKPKRGSSGRVGAAARKSSRHAVTTPPTTHDRDGDSDGDGNGDRDGSRDHGSRASDGRELKSGGEDSSLEHRAKLAKHYHDMSRIAADVFNSMSEPSKTAREKANALQLAYLQKLAQMENM